MKKSCFQIAAPVCFLLWSGLFLFLTLQDGEETLQTGSAFALWLGRTLHLSRDPAELHLLLRTAAHIVFSAVECFLLTLTLYAFHSGNRTLWVCLLLSCLIGVLMELIKLPIPGRHFSWSETGLNMLSGAIGTLLAAGLFRLLRGH